MHIIHAVLLGIVEGVTEFLPISSTGHLTIFEKLLGYHINDPDITAFTAIIQSGAVFATIVYLRKDLWRLLVALLRGITTKSARANNDYRYAWAVILGSIPVGIVGFLFQDSVKTTLRSLWVVAIALIVWSGVMWLADRMGKQDRHQANVTWKDTIIIGIAQCLALMPGVSRSGATMSAGLFRGIDRVTVTKLSFFLSIPALFGATVLQLVTESGNISNGVGWIPTIVATIASFVVAYGAVAWLLKFIAKHNYNVFIGYRIVLGIVLIVLLATGTIDAV
jgi:undecaprenyl-diphosphatase